jgi:hypothetical protein
MLSLRKSLTLTTKKGPSGYWIFKILKAILLFTLQQKVRLASTSES